ncbi:hypothetical protein WSK_3025 [Novosphingobium sp. Rr 2-17]|uniref:UrcA family protein n=1 Tax=Novosphingobium sp. Rr 2-17 TaxID=555793 RepID=UPI000269AB7D|nr:UrcA family protein [Novosphingobium sp. Rr 2-17]EIZ78406.1 hypothetical protein WSK_3025 [Novosphingobium sp. Rr 2-17]
MFKIANTTTAIAAAAICTAALFASPAAYAKSVEVSYADLDLTTAEGQKALDRRLNRAARSACGLDEVTTGTHLPSASARLCYEQARAKSKERLAEAIASKSERLGG